MQNNKGKILSGVVVSDKMKDTVVVAVLRFVKHLKYKKYYKVSKKYKAHNPGNTVHIGDKVDIRETRPISKDKHFVVIENSKLKIENSDEDLDLEEAEKSLVKDYKKWEFLFEADPNYYNDEVSDSLELRMDNFYQNFITLQIGRAHV